jgi:myo-inositol 2-dehydrogenase / D-chiro-inositol 1-dehydrogenase
MCTSREGANTVIDIAVIGGAFAGNLHAEAINRTAKGRVCSGVSRSAESREAFSARWSVPTFATLEELLDSVPCDAISIAAPNYLHRPLVELAASRGISSICEKPLAPTYADALAMVETCAKAGVHLLYAEQLCFAPRYVRVKELIDDGSFGTLIQLNHWERHGGPHAQWFYDPSQSGGGVVLDMACHGIALTRWLNGNSPVVSVSAHLNTFVHREHPVEDHSLIILRFANDVIAVVDSSWAAPGGIDERLEVLGIEGSVSADLARGQSLLAYSDVGLSGAAEKTTRNTGLVRIPHDEAYTWGWFGEFAHFVDVLAGDAQPMLTGQDGLEVLGIVAGAYVAAAENRIVTPPWPTGPDIVSRPWLDR